MTQKLYYLIVAILLAVSCNPPDSPAPVITSVTPEELHPGSDIIIEGQFLGEIRFVLLNDVKFKGYSIGSDSIIAKIPRSVPVGVYSLSVMSNDENSNSIQVTITPAKPVLDSINPSTAKSNDTLIIIGYFFEDNQLEVHIGDLVLSSFIEQNDSIIKLLVTDDFKPGQLTVENTFGISNPKPFNFEEDEVVEAPVISIIRPKSNAKGGPMLIYGKNLEQVKKIRFGNSITISVPDFAYFPTSEGEEIIALHVPDNIQPGEILVSLTLGNELIHSEDVLFTVLPGSLELPVYLPEIVTPNPPPVNILDNLNNQWLKMDKQSRIAMNVDSETEPGQIFVTINNTNAGKVNVQDNSISLFIDSREYYGKLDNSYFNPDVIIRRLILTPVEQGNQIEMVFPYYLESISPEKVHPGDSITFSGRYFMDEESWGIWIGDTILTKEVCRKISDIQVKLRIPENADIGIQNAVIYNDTDGFISNSRPFEILSE